MSESDTVPADLFRHALEGWARSKVGAPQDAPAFAQRLKLRWHVTVLDGGEHLTFRLAETHTDQPHLVPVPELHLCAECGERLGDGASYERDDYQRIDGRRWLVSAGGWDGCESCVGYAQQQDDDGADWAVQDASEAGRGWL